AAVALDLSPFAVAVEGYRQFGSAGVDLRAAGHAFRAVARYSDGAWVQGVFVRVSGDRRGDDGREGRFLSYEDNDATLIVEGNEFGFDIDNNYETVQFSAGIPIPAGGTTIYPQVLVALFRFLEAVPLPPDPPFGVSGRSRTLGTEVDATLDAALNRQLSI